VLLKDGRVIAEGAYEGPGRPHAEIAALQQAGAAARGATAYVTLEPCSHRSSRDGAPRNACSDALIEAGVAHVIMALEDPDPRTAGQGRSRLRAAGVAVDTGDGAEESARLLEAYLKHRRTGLPFVVVKYAASLDGRIAAGSGDSRWVSGPETLRWAHANRTLLDAIMVGASTIVVDDSQLTARPGGILSTRQPLRVVVDSSGRIPTTAKVLSGNSKTLVATTERSSRDWRAGIEATGAEVLTLAADEDGRVPLRPLLEELGRRDVLLLLSEGGGVLHGSLFDQRLVDKVTAVIAPMIIGAEDAPTAVSGRGARYMREAARLQDVTVERLGEDVLVTGYPVWPA
jgi:diaminohydroxyphosphoribosylaminopyrimidine deaminase/5-amino-6-(5-phosphoribosylamino)uracil reductase